MLTKNKDLDVVKLKEKQEKMKQNDVRMVGSLC